MPQQPRRYPRRDPNVVAFLSANPNPDRDEAVSLFLVQRTGNNVAGSTIVTYRDYLLGPRMRSFRPAGDATAISSVIPARLRVGNRTDSNTEAADSVTSRVGPGHARTVTATVTGVAGVSSEA